MSTSTGRTSWGLLAAVGAAVAASACCTIPLLLVTLGLGGAWVGTLTALEPFRPFFIALAIGALGYAGYREWRISRGPDCDCETGLPEGLRRSLLGIGFAAALGLIASPWILRDTVTAEAAASPALTEAALEQVVLEVEGMTCASCTVSARKALTRLEGVREALVTYEPPQAVVTYDPAQVTAAEMAAALTNVGYTSKRKTR